MYTHTNTRYYWTSNPRLIDNSFTSIFSIVLISLYHSTSVHYPPSCVASIRTVLLQSFNDLEFSLQGHAQNLFGCLNHTAQLIIHTYAICNI